MDSFHSGIRSGCFTKDNSSGLTMEWMNLPALSGAYHPAKLSMWLKSEEPIDADVVVWMSVGGKEVYHEIRSLKDVMEPSSDWQEVTYTFVLPDAEGKDSKFSWYVVNRSPSSFFYDDVHLQVFP